MKKNHMYFGTVAQADKKLLSMNLQLFAGRLVISSEGGEYIPQPASGANKANNVQEVAQEPISEPVAPVEETPKETQQVEEVQAEPVKEDTTPDKTIELEGNTIPDSDKKHHKFAEMRVANKELKAQLEAVQAELKSRDDKISKVDKYINDLHGDKGITNIDSYLSHMSDYERKQLQEKAIQGDSEAMQTLLNEQLMNNPMMEKINQVSEYLEQQALDNNIRSELDEFNTEYDQKLTSYKDIANLDNSDDIYNFMEKGLTVSQAYIIANKDSIINKAAKETKQETINNIAGRSHMSANGAGTGNADKVVQISDMPPETYNMYKRLFKGKKSDKQILDHWKKSQK